MKLIIVVLAWLVLMTVQAFAQTTFVWDRNTEADVDHYEMFVCRTSPTCIPGTAPTDRIGTNVPQSPLGTKPTMPIPVNDEGRAAVRAVDLVGNPGGLSNIVPFDRKAPVASTGLVAQ